MIVIMIPKKFDGKKELKWVNKELQEFIDKICKNMGPSNL